MSNATEIERLEREIARLKAEDAARQAAGLIYKCPQCKASGKIPSPDETEFVEGWVDEIDPASYWSTGRQCRGMVKQPRIVACPLCEGRGYRRVESKPVMVQSGWE